MNKWKLGTSGNIVKVDEANQLDLKASEKCLKELDKWLNSCKRKPNVISKKIWDEIYSAFLDYNDLVDIVKQK